MNHFALLLAILSGFILASCGREDVPQEPERGVDLTYTLVFPKEFKGDRKAEVKRVVEILKKRLTGSKRKGVVRANGEGKILVRLPTQDPGKIRDLKKLLERQGTFGMHAEADGPVVKEFERTGKVPKGYLTGGSPKSILYRSEPAINANHITKIFTRESPLLGGQPEWVIGFMLNSDGATRLDTLATELFGRKPPGRAAMVVDGTVHSTPVMMSKRFGGAGQLSNSFTKQEADDLAAVLQAGRLPFPLELKTESTFGPPEK